MFNKIKKIFIKTKNRKNNNTEWEAVKSKWLNIIKKDNHHTEGWVQLISAELNLSQFDNAIENAIKAQNIFTANKLFTVLEARAHLGNKNFDNAKKLYNNVLSIEEYQTEAYLQLSLIGLYEEDYKSAISYASQIEEESQAKLYLGRAYLRSDDKDKALIYWEELYLVDNYKQEASVQLVSIYISKNKVEEGKKIVEESSKEYPKNITLLNLKAKIYEMSGEYSTSLEVYKNMIKLVSKKEEIFLKISKIYLQQDDLSNAQHYTSLALSENKNYLDAMVIDARISKKMI